MSEGCRGIYGCETSVIREFGALDLLRECEGGEREGDGCSLRFFELASAMSESKPLGMVGKVQ